MSHADWISPSIHPSTLNKLARELAHAIKEDMKNGLPVTCIAVRGVSGLVMGAAVSLKTRLPLVIVRKPDESRHSSYLVEYDNDIRTLNYVVIDDLVSTGETIQKIMDAIRGERYSATLRMVYLYHDSPTKYETDSDGNPWENGHKSYFKHHKISGREFPVRCV